MSHRLRTLIPALLAAFVPVLAVTPGPATAGTPGAAPELGSPWQVVHETRTRLIAGTSPQGQLYAGVEIELPPGWKTYWRSPGEAGGVPPEFDWSGSANLASAQLHYPAPERIVDATGVTYGYHRRAVFLAEIRKEKADKPADLRLKAAYGICKNICIPVEVSLALAVPAEGGGPLPPVLAAALQRVPRPQNALQAEDPRLLTVTAENRGAGRAIIFTVRFPGGSADAMVILDGPGGLYLPEPRILAHEGETVTFEAVLSASDLAALGGNPPRAAFFTPRGQSESVLGND